MTQNFSFDFSENLDLTIKKLVKKDKARVLILNKKIKEIVSCDETTIDRYKNLRYGLSDYKRVHVDRSFVLIFRVFKKEKHVLFERLEHHDVVYGKN
ncbi:MAG: addiction module toxin RelE [Candidatus Micrarchaeota archaeon]